jgi:hypothetical protein
MKGETKMHTWITHTSTVEHLNLIFMARCMLQVVVHGKQFGSHLLVQVNWWLQRFLIPAHPFINKLKQDESSLKKDEATSYYSISKLMIHEAENVWTVIACKEEIKISKCPTSQCKILMTEKDQNVGYSICITTAFVDRGGFEGYSDVWANTYVWWSYTKFLATLDTKIDALALLLAKKKILLT